MGKAKATAPQVHQSIRMIPIDRLEPNPWNPNELKGRGLEATREAIEAFGFIDPLTVRPGSREGYYQIIDGEHRWRLAPELKLTALPCNVVEEPADLRAKKLTSVLNQHGRPDPVELLKLLARIDKDLGPDTGKGLAYTEDQLKEMITAAGAAWRIADAQGTVTPFAPKAPGETTMHFVVPTAGAATVKRALAEVPGLAAEDSAGRLTALCESYLREVGS